MADQLKEHIWELEERLDWWENFADAVRKWDDDLYHKALKYADEIKEGCI